MLIYREIQDIWPQLAAEYPVLVVTGTRQVGKTTLLETLYGLHSTVSLDLPAHAAQAQHNGQQFLAGLTLPAVIDEVQYAPSLFRDIKAFCDKSLRNKTGQLFLTGSEKFALMNGVSESLAGRAAVVELHSLSHRELERWSGKTSEGHQLLEWIYKGGYPKLHAQNLDTERFYSNLVATYIDRDIKRLSNIKNTQDFDRFLRLLALRSGQLLSMASLAVDVGVSQTTIKHWVNMLVASHVVALVPPWYSNVSKRLIKTPKVFFYDTGLCCYLAGLRSAMELEKSPLLGAFFETHAFGQIVRAWCNRGVLPRICFFRTQEGFEVDFVLMHGTEASLFECKYGASPHTHPKVIDQFEKITQLTVRKLSYICSGRHGYPTTDPRVVVQDSIDF